MQLPFDFGLSRLPLWAQAGGTFWLPPQSSSTAKYVDTAFHFLLAVSTFFFVLIVALMILFVILYRRRPGVEAVATATHNTALEIVWSAIPLGLVVVIFWLGFRGYMEMRVAPRNAYEIQVTARQWSWSFKYPNGYVDPNLHVPPDEAVRLTMMSTDVIHSLFIPAFRLKMDVVPDRYTTTWFKAITPGEYDLECTEYCGSDHYAMLAKVIVHETTEDFQRWLEAAEQELKNASPVDAGRAVVTRYCAVCHTSDGRVNVGPSFKGIWGETHAFANASPQVVDENYIRESIIEPSKKVREGYPDRMSTFKGQLSKQDIDNVIAYIQSLK